MKIIDSYLSKNTLYPAIAIISILSIIILVTQSLKYIDLIISYGTKGSDFLYVTVLLLPSLLFIIIPICLYIAVVYNVNKLNSYREINILKGSGISNFSISKPILKIAIGISIFHYFLSLYLMPIINHEFKNFTKNLKESYVTFFIQEKVFNHPTKFLTFYIDKKISDTKFEGIFYQDMRGIRPVTLVAKTGDIIKKDGQIFLSLVDGNRQELNEKDELVLLSFDTLLVQLDFNKNLGSDKNRIIQLQEKNIMELIFFDKYTSPSLKLRMISEASNRLTWPLYNIILTLLALSAFLLGEYSRAGKTKQIIFCSIIAGIIVIINNSLINLGATYKYVIILSYIFTFASLGLLIHTLFYRDRYGI
jgi:lipopolysaccharide export system permease protein